MSKELPHVNFVKCAMQTKYANKLKNEPQDERLPRKFPQGTRQVRDYDTFLILLTFTSNTFF